MFCQAIIGRVVNCTRPPARPSISARGCGAIYERLKGPEPSSRAAKAVIARSINSPGITCPGRTLRDLFRPVSGYPADSRVRLPPNACLPPLIMARCDRIFLLLEIGLGVQYQSSHDDRSLGCRSKDRRFEPYSISNIIRIFKKSVT